MVKPSDLGLLLKFLCPEFSVRVKNCELKRPSELGFQVDRQNYRLILGSRKVKLAQGKLGRSVLRCSTTSFTQLLLGHIDIEEAIDSGKILATTRVAREIAQKLFLRSPLWRPPLDDLPA